METIDLISFAQNDLCWVHNNGKFSDRSANEPLADLYIKLFVYVVIHSYWWWSAAADEMTQPADTLIGLSMDGPNKCKWTIFCDYRVLGRGLAATQFSLFCKLKMTTVFIWENFACGHQNSLYLIYCIIFQMLSSCCHLPIHEHYR